MKDSDGKKAFSYWRKLGQIRGAAYSAVFELESGGNVKDTIRELKKALKKTAAPFPAWVDFEEYNRSGKIRSAGKERWPKKKASKKKTK